MSGEFAEYVVDQLAPLGEVECGRFFGGWGLKSGGVQFAMIMQDTLYFVVSDATRPKYVEAGSKPFSYEKKGGVQEVHRYYEVPADVLEEPGTFLAWAEEAITASKRGK